jgi:glycosyltransferase involved in cell wall biosynthesis
MRRLRLEGPDFTRPTVAILAGRDVVCLPSRFEGFSLVALEAMLAARVLLVSEDAGIAPHVTASRCGIVVKAEVEAVARGMLELLSRRAEWRDMGLRGRAHAIEQLQWHAIARRALCSYEEFAGSSPSRSGLRAWDTNPTAPAPRV